MTFSGKSVFRRNRQERGKENDGAMSGAETTTSSEKNKRVILNIITAIGYQVVIAVFGLVLPRLYLVNFGSEVNGLNSTIKNIFAYLSLLEAGVGLPVWTCSKGRYRGHQWDFVCNTQVLPEDERGIYCDYSWICAVISADYKNGAGLFYGLLHHPAVWCAWNRTVFAAGKVQCIS